MSSQPNPEDRPAGTGSSRNNVNSLIYKMRASQIDADADANRLASGLAQTHLSENAYDASQANVQSVDKGKKRINHPPNTTLPVPVELPVRGRGESFFHRPDEFGRRHEQQGEPSNSAVIDFSTSTSIQHAMSEHHARFPSTVASSSYTAPPGPLPPLTTYISHYNGILREDFSSNALSHAPLPSNLQMLEELSMHMAGEAYRRYRMGFAPVLSPLQHPWYPFWLPEHEVNYAVRALVERGEAE